MLTDLHCHLLPGIDDGARDLDQALAMARIARADGISTVVVTPHHLNGVYRNPAERVRAALRALQDELDRAGVMLRLLPGAELHLVPELPDALASGEALTLADRGKAALVELPVHTVPVGAEHLLEQILAQGITPVIAHPERNSELRRHPERLDEWVAFGCLAQVTAQSCSGKFGDGALEAARVMIRSGSVHVIASDAHRDRRRVPRITTARQAVHEWVGDAAAGLLLRDFPTALAQGRMPDLQALGQALPPPAAPARWRRWLGLGA